jgi:hypothetical protein
MILRVKGLTKLVSKSLQTSGSMVWYMSTCEHEICGEDTSTFHEWKCPTRLEQFGDEYFFCNYLIDDRMIESKMMGFLSLYGVFQ